MSATGTASGAGRHDESPTSDDMICVIRPAGWRIDYPPCTDGNPGTGDGPFLVLPTLDDALKAVPAGLTHMIVRDE